MDTKNNKFLIPLAILIAGVLVAGALIYSPDKAEEIKLAPGSGLADSLIDDDVVLGSPDAPLTIVSFGDYQCPVCEVSFSQIEESIRKEYVDTGKVKFVYRDFPLDQLHPFARKAAEAAECARDQSSFWQYHDELFQRQSEIPTLDFAAVAGGLGLDVSVFSQCVSEGKYKDEVQKDFQDGFEVGVTGTPTLIIGTQVLQGVARVDPYAPVKQVIEQELQKVK